MGAEKYKSLSRREVLAGGLAATVALAAPSRGSAQDVTTITIWGNHPEWSSDLEAIIAAFEQSHDGIKIQPSFKPMGSYSAALNTALAGGAAPDIIGLSPGGQVALLAKSGQIMDLSDFVNAENLLDESRIQVELDGGVWGAPLALPVVGKFYRPSLFLKAGVEVPQTGADLMSVLKGLQSAGITPYAVGGGDAFGPFDLYTGAASAIMGPDGFADLRTGKLKLTDTKLLPAAQYLLDVAAFFETGWLNQSIAQAHDMFTTGRAAITPGGASDLAGFRAADASIDAEMFASLPPPGVDGIPVGLYGNELIYAVNAQSTNAEAAAKFVGWLAGAEAQQIVADRLSLPTVKGVTPKDPVKARMLGMSKVRMPVWWDMPELAETFPAFAQKGMPMFTNGISPLDMAAAVQSAIKPSVS